MTAIAEGRDTRDLFAAGNAHGTKAF